MESTLLQIKTTSGQKFTGKTHEELMEDIVDRGMSQEGFTFFVDDCEDIIEGISRYEGEGENKEQNRQEQIVSAFEMLFEASNKKLEEYKDKDKDEEKYNNICKNIYNIICYCEIKEIKTEIDEKTKEKILKFAPLVIEINDKYFAGKNPEKLMEDILNRGILQKGFELYSYNCIKIVKEIYRYEGEEKKEDKQEQIISAYKILFERLVENLEKYKNEENYNCICKNIHNIIRYGIKNTTTGINEETRKEILKFAPLVVKVNNKYFIGKNPKELMEDIVNDKISQESFWLDPYDYVELVEEIYRYEGEGESEKKEQNRQEQIVSAFEMLFKKLVENLKKYKNNEKEYNCVCKNTYYIIEFGIKHKITGINEETKKEILKFAPLVIEINDKYFAGKNPKELMGDILNRGILQEGFKLRYSNCVEIVEEIDRYEGEGNDKEQKEQDKQKQIVSAYKMLFKKLKEQDIDEKKQDIMSLMDDMKYCIENEEIIISKETKMNLLKFGISQEKSTSIPESKSSQPMQTEGYNTPIQQTPQSKPVPQLKLTQPTTTSTTSTTISTTIPPKDKINKHHNQQQVGGFSMCMNGGK